MENVLNQYLATTKKKKNLNTKLAALKKQKYLSKIPEAKKLIPYIGKDQFTTKQVRILLD
jgi:hypothetical protein